MSCLASEDRDKYPDRNFVRIWPASFVSAVTGLGEAQFLFALYLLRRCTKSNYINGTLEDLILKSNLSRDTVRGALRRFRERDFLRRVGVGRIMINPEMVFAGSDSARKEAMYRYKRMNVIEREVPTNQGLEQTDSELPLVFDKDTGEIISAASETYNGFIKLWPKDLASVFFGLGRKRLRFACFLLTRIMPDNRVYGTKAQLAKCADVSMDIAYSTIRLLSEREFLCVESNTKIIINPDVAAYDTTHRRLLLVKEFNNIARKYKTRAKAS